MPFIALGILKVTVQLLLLCWLCRSAGPSKAGRVWWCSTTTDSTDNVKIVSKTPLSYYIRLLSVVCMVLFCVVCVQLQGDFSNYLYKQWVINWSGR